MGVQAGSTATEASNSSKHSITQHYDDQTPRIDAPDAAAIPSPNLLVKLSKAVPGKIVGSYTTKVIAGSMIGVGALFLLSGYGAVVAIPLIASGGALWLASTTVSLADIEGKDATSVILHLVKSVGSLVGGAALSFLFTFIIPGTAALISGAFIAIPTSGIALTLGSFGLDYKNLGKNPTFAKVMHSDIRTHLSKKGGGFYENPPDVESALAYIRQGNNPTNVFIIYLDTVRAQKLTENPQDLDK